MGEIDINISNREENFKFKRKSLQFSLKRDLLLNITWSRLK